MELPRLRCPWQDCRVLLPLLQLAAFSVLRISTASKRELPSECAFVYMCTGFIIMRYTCIRWWSRVNQDLYMGNPGKLEVEGKRVWKEGTVSTGREQPPSSWVRQKENPVSFYFFKGPGHTFAGQTNLEPFMWSKLTVNSERLQVYSPKCLGSNSIEPDIEIILSTHPLTRCVLSTCYGLGRILGTTMNKNNKIHD